MAAAAESLTGEIKDLLTIQIKPRHDPMCDQYSRIFMVKLLLVCTIIIGVNQYQDTVQCIVPESLDICSGDDDPDSSCQFLHAACWIQGMYVYKQLLDRVNDVAYFGMPKNIDQDGYINGTDDLCEMVPRLDATPNPKCIPMDKTFYLQYQWMAFFVAALAVLYYLPYVMFCKINSDLICLRANMKSDNKVADEIMKGYFKRDSTTRADAWLRPLLNVAVKALYVCSNIITFLALDNVLNGEYLRYGKRWIDWAKLGNTVMYDYMGMRDFPKPGNRLLPPFGYCEFFESAKDIKISKSNQVKVVCEISQHILYQYCLLLLWFCIVVGIAVSILGLLHTIWTYITNFVKMKSKTSGFGGATLREMDYITYIKTRDRTMYGNIMEKLKEQDYV